MEEERAADNPMLLSGLSKHWNSPPAFNAGNRAGDEK